VDLNSVWLLSMAQGIQTTSMRNLLRYESLHERQKMPDDRLFPFSADWHPTGRAQPANGESPGCVSQNGFTSQLPDVRGLQSVRKIDCRPLNQFSAFGSLQQTLAREIVEHVVQPGAETTSPAAESAAPAGDVGGNS
jgi:hypothetical protein